MRRLPLQTIVLAALLAVLLPLEQAHCLWMGLGAPARTATASAMPMKADHSCCRGHAGHRGGPAPECACLQLPQAAMPHAVSIGAPPAAPLACAVVVALAFDPPAPDRGAARGGPPPDAGSAPLPILPAAHGLRAPPLA